MSTDDLHPLKERFDASRQEWLDAGHGDKWVVIGEKTLLGFFQTYREAVEKAVVEFGDKIFLVQQVLDEDPTESIQHVYWELNT